MPVEHQRHGATAAAHALLLAGYSVHVAPSLNTLAAPDGDRQAARRYLDRLTERARAAETDQGVAAVLAEIAAPEEGLLLQFLQSLISTWATWGERRREDGLDDHARRITQIRNQAARHTPPAAAPGMSVPPPAPSAAPSARRR
ncbi:hypothetical protein ACIQOF_27335 [Streptomyces sp. NPDC091265]|uniref:hypothetical protein n=1 Tax=unclassified Streptomyces TaxID=2593676 RepID=UPI00344F6663